MEGADIGRWRGPRQAGVAGALLPLLLVTALLAPETATAATCPRDAAQGTRLGDVPVEERLRFLRERLDAERGPAELWANTWLAFDAAFLAGQVAAVPFTKETGARVVLVGGAVTAALGVGQLLFLSIKVESVPPELDVAEPCAALSRLEAALVRSARNEALGSGPAAQLGNVLVNGMLGVIAGFAAEKWTSGAVTAGLGWVVGEIQILTQPTTLVGDLERYRAGELAPPEAPRVRVVPAAGAGVGVSIAVSF